jgi:hypothetical protein
MNFFTKKYKCPIIKTVQIYTIIMDITNGTPESSINKLYCPDFNPEDGGFKLKPRQSKFICDKVIMHLMRTYGYSYKSAIDYLNSAGTGDGMCNCCEPGCSKCDNQVKLLVHANRAFTMIMFKMLKNNQSDDIQNQLRYDVCRSCKCHNKMIQRYNFMPIDTARLAKFIHTNIDK